MGQKMSKNQKKGSKDPLGKSTNNSGPENCGNELNELEMEPITWKAKVQMLEAREKSLEKKLQESQDEFVSLEKKYQNEILELKVKNQKLTEESEEKIRKLEEMIQQKTGETETEVMVPIHQMKVQLPLENWYDFLAFVPRSQLGNVVSQIGDYQFTYIIQSFLHEFAKITLDKMIIIPPQPDAHNGQPMVHVMPNTTTNMPDWPMPGNIKNFTEIVLNYVDASVIHFLGKFHENSLLTDVNIYFHRKLRRLDENNLPQILTNILPFITSIDSIHSRRIDLFEMANNTNHDNNHESQLLLKEMMSKTRILLTRWYVFRPPRTWKYIMDGLCSWLYTPRNDGKPRMLRLYDDHLHGHECASFIERIKEDFEMSNHAVSFFVNAYILRDNNVEDISIDNVKTNEKLVIKSKIVDDGNKKCNKLMIWRYPLKAAKNWIETNENEITAIWWHTRIKQNRKITLTI